MKKYKLKQWIDDAPRKKELQIALCEALGVSRFSLRVYWNYRKLQREKLGIAKKRKIVETIRFHYKQHKTEVTEITIDNFKN